MNGEQGDRHDRNALIRQSYREVATLTTETQRGHPTANVVEQCELETFRTMHDVTSTIPMLIREDSRA